MDEHLGLAHLSALHLSPPELVVAAAQAGFRSVGVRVHPATAGERRHPVDPGGAVVAETLRRSRDLGVVVRDVEVFTLDGRRGREDWLPVLEVGAELGATVLNMIGGDPDRARFTGDLAALVEDAVPFGIRPSIEPISYQCVDTVVAAGEVAAATGAGIMLDVLHFVRSGGVVADLVALPTGAVTVIQLCDGPAEVPDLPTPWAMPLGQSTDGSPRQLESRAKRVPPGQGAFPLVDVLRALPGVPISVEVPDVWAAVGADGVQQHLTRLFRAASDVVDAAATAGAHR